MTTPAMMVIILSKYAINGPAAVIHPTNLREALCNFAMVMLFMFIPLPSPRYTGEGSTTPDHSEMRSRALPTIRRFTAIPACYTGHKSIQYCLVYIPDNVQHDNHVRTPHPHVEHRGSHGPLIPALVCLSQ